MVACIVWARLKLASAGQRLQLVDGLHRLSVFTIVVCGCASAFRTPGEMRKYFYDELQDILNDIPITDLLRLLGDFNAQMYS